MIPMYQQAFVQDGAAPPVPWRVAARRGKARGEFGVAAGSTRQPRTVRNGTADSNQYVRRANATDGSESAAAEATPRSRAFSRTHARVSQARCVGSARGTTEAHVHPHVSAHPRIPAARRGVAAARGSHPERWSSVSGGKMAAAVRNK